MAVVTMIMMMVFLNILHVLKNHFPNSYDNITLKSCIRLTSTLHALLFLEGKIIFYIYNRNVRVVTKF
jgi:hypothetical protein